MARWVSQIVMSDGANGELGGNWELSIAREVGLETDNHWWDLYQDNRRFPTGCDVFRTSTDHEIALVRIKANLPFEAAASVYDLDLTVFGGMTLWPGAHFRNEVRDQVSGGYSWIFEDPPVNFPFKNDS